MKQRELQRLTTKDIQQIVPTKIDTILLPVGTVEAHGASALGTDNFIPESLAEYLADKIDALIAPTVNYGITKSLYGHPGSITVETDNFINYILDILKSFSDNKF
ncbi:MAG: creatininase family protein, partial [candidate division Zixibacteria bacterium]|nr:creatininase family protein [candidate division Zixibacteria bacterium]